jgi:pilus assembly protein CpaF
MFFGGRKPEHEKSNAQPEVSAAAEPLARPVLAGGADIAIIADNIMPMLRQNLGATTIASLTRPELVSEIKARMADVMGAEIDRLTLLDQRNLVSLLADRILVPTIAEKVLPEIKYRLDALTIASLDRAQLAREVRSTMKELMMNEIDDFSSSNQQELLSTIVDRMKSEIEAQQAAITPESLQRLAEEAGERAIVAAQTKAAAEKLKVEAEIKAAGPTTTEVAQQRLARMAAHRTNVEFAKNKIQQILLERIDTSAAANLPREQLRKEIFPIASEILAEQRLNLNNAEREELVEQMLDDMLGLGPLEPLLADEGITDIMVNGAKHIFVERKGKLELTEAEFRDNDHVMTVAQRIVTAVGRRVDESTPLVDARLKDGSRVNIIIPPLAIDGASISIRKFSKKKISLDIMEKQNNLSTAMAALCCALHRAHV